jgi:hypothetical protein
MDFDRIFALTAAAFTAKAHRSQSSAPPEYVRDHADG